MGPPFYCRGCRIDEAIAFYLERHSTGGMHNDAVSDIAIYWRNYASAYL